MKICAFSEHAKVAELLIQNGVDVNKPGEYRGTAIMWAAVLGKFIIVYS